jgi:hypothetical protein
MTVPSRTVLLEDAGHLTMLERPRTVNEQIDQWSGEAQIAPHGAGGD